MQRNAEAIINPSPRMPLRLNEFRIGSMTRLVILSALASCTACVPMSQSYFLPSAEGAQVASILCTGGPPYAANFSGPGFRLLAYIDRKSLQIAIRAGGTANIVFDPTQIRIEAAGRTFAVESAVYRVSVSEPKKSATGQFEVNSANVSISAPIEVEGLTEVITHLPPVTVNGEVTELPAITFKHTSTARLVPIVANC